jgi:quinol monooxygenase YgiN
MSLASITRLRVRSVRYLPEFLLRALTSVRQARRSPGCLSADVRREVKLIFWTRTVWQDEAAMRAFMTTGAHRAVMPKILEWCDEAAVAHWQQDGERPPDWPTAEARMRTEGRTSRVRHPSPAHRRGETVPATATRSDLQ